MIARKNSLLRQSLLAATLAVGFGTLWFVLTLWLGTSILRAWPGWNQPPFENLVVKSDGTPLIESIPSENMSLATYRDIKGVRCDAVGRNERSPTMYMSGGLETSGALSQSLGWERRIKVFVDEREPTANWYFVHDGKQEGGGYFVGYESESNRRIGFIGRSGFRSHSVPTDEQIRVRGALVKSNLFWSSAPVSIDSGRMSMMRPDPRDLPPRLVYVPSGNRLRLVDLAARTIATAAGIGRGSCLLRLSHPKLVARRLATPLARGGDACQRYPLGKRNPRFLRPRWFLLVPWGGLPTGGTPRGCCRLPLRSKSARTACGIGTPVESRERANQ
ncbi:hypothetical protein SAMN05444166_2874 [Singulisphaera sp. GP187]|nr:hypothetical protein SAMN05444166_2874 [Singulisphaera sp. GP187]